MFNLWSNVSFLQVVAAIKRILYAADDDPSVVAEAQAMVSLQQKEALSPIVETSSEEKMNSDSQKRKCIVNYEVDSTLIAALSPRQRLSEATDVHCSGSPLMSYWFKVQSKDVFLITSALQNSFLQISCSNTFAFGCCVGDGSNTWPLHGFANLFLAILYSLLRRNNINFLPILLDNILDIILV